MKLYKHKHVWALFRAVCTGSNAASQCLRCVVLSLKMANSSTSTEEDTLEKVNLIIILQMGLSICSGMVLRKSLQLQDSPLG